MEFTSIELLELRRIWQNLLNLVSPDELDGLTFDGFCREVWFELDNLNTKY